MARNVQRYQRIRKLHTLFNGEYIYGALFTKIVKFRSILRITLRIKLRIILRI